MDRLIELVKPLQEVATKTGLVLVALVMVYIFFMGAMELLDRNGYGKENKNPPR